ncbi:MAG TPA: hypothetical protein VKB71_02965 [Rhizomicrobium sp.]|nr:hypothetical protein [Rhizomicrobium sp.]
MSTRDAWKSLLRGGTLAFVLGASPAHADSLAKDTPQPIREFDIPTVEKLGREMYDQDQLAWKATDIAVGHFTVEVLKTMKTHGWIVEPSASGNIVRFIRETPNGPQLFYDVNFTPDGAASSSIPQNTTLSADEKMQYYARTLALASIPRTCSDNYNTIALKDPQGDGWLIWAMAATMDPKVVVIGGHYRFTISADGKTVRQTDALSYSCLTMSKPDPKEGTPVGVYTGQFVSLTPLETTVFAALSYKTPMFVGTRDGRSWKFDGDAISIVDADSAGSDGFAARSLAGLAEKCSVISAKPGESNYDSSEIPSVILETEQADKFNLSLPEGSKVGEIVCVRLDIVPAPNDYKVLAAGYPLLIMDRGLGHAPRWATLWFEKGTYGFHIDRGDDLTADQKAKVGARVAAFRSAMGKN